MHFTTQETDEDEAESHARYKSLYRQAEDVERHSSNWIVNDLSLNLKYLGIGPYALFELIEGHVQWILYEYEKCDIDGTGNIGMAGPEDPDFRHGSVVLLYKTPTTIPSKDLGKFLNCMTQQVSISDTIDFFNDIVLDTVTNIDQENAKRLYRVMKKQIDILKTETGEQHQYQAARFLWGIWFDHEAFRGLYAITRWTRQETNVNIPMVMSPLMRAIKKDMGKNFKWMNGAVATVNFVSNDMLHLNYEECRESPMPDYLPFKFFETAGPSRLIKEPDPAIKLIRCIKSTQVDPREYDDDPYPPGFNAEHYTFDFWLAHNGKNLFITCIAGQKLMKGVDAYTQGLLCHPNFHLYADENDWNYYLGVDEYCKLDEQNKLMQQIKLYQEKMAKQQRDIEELKYGTQDHQNENDDTESEQGKDEKDKQEDEVIDDEYEENNNKDANGDIQGDGNDKDASGDTEDDGEDKDENGSDVENGDTEDGDTEEDEKDASGDTEDDNNDKDENGDTEDTDVENGDTEDDDKDEKDKQEHEVSDDKDKQNKEKDEDADVEDDESLSDTAV